MKFKAKITDDTAIGEFINVCNGLSKLSKTCIIRIVPNKVYFIISDDDVGPKQPSFWCELPAAFYFKEFTLVGLSTEHNEIYLSFSTSMLAKSVGPTRQHVRCLKLKLTNKQTPCLTIEIEQACAEEMENRHCVHDIPVEIILRQYWDDYSEPIFNDFHVSIEMPTLRSIKSIVERMKCMSPTIIVSANKDGRLTLKIKTNVVTISAHFPDLNVASFVVGQNVSNSNDDADILSENVNVTVDIKKFLMFLSSMQLNNSKTTLSIVHKKMLKFNLQQTSLLSIQYFLTQVTL